MRLFTFHSSDDLGIRRQTLTLSTTNATLAPANHRGYFFAQNGKRFAIKVANPTLK